MIDVLRLIHVLVAIIWIGGLAFVTIIIFPIMYKIEKPLEKVLFFQRIEHKFAKIARIYSAVVVLTGFGMLFHFEKQSLLFTIDGIFLTIMMIIGIIWIILLFGVEKLIIKKMLDRLAQSPEKMTVDSTFKRMNVMHWVLLSLSLLAAAGGILFTHP